MFGVLGALHQWVASMSFSTAVLEIFFLGVSPTLGKLVTT